MNTINVGIIGATGYAGVELIRLLYNHPAVNIAALSSISFEGKQLSDVYPSFKKIVDDKLTSEDEVIAKSDVVFASVPHGLSEKIALKCMASKVKLVDLGADFRLSSEEDYKLWYGLNYENKELHKKSIYCIPELHREKVKNCDIIANPGCYPTSIALGLAPLLINKLINTETIIIDSKSGVTGAGRGLSQNTHYPDCNEAFGAYKIAEHRHTPEIEETLSKLANIDVKITFVPHLLPVNRGILSTIYAQTSLNNQQELLDIYNNFYKNEKFVRVQKNGEVANLKNIKCSNYCDISVHFDSRTKRVIIVSVIDNMVKGAAGQAIQNMNILFNLKEDTGLDFIPTSF